MQHTKRLYDFDKLNATFFHNVKYIMKFDRKKDTQKNDPSYGKVFYTNFNFTKSLSGT